MPVKPSDLAAGIRMALDLASVDRLDQAEAMAGGLTIIDPNNAFLHLLRGSFLQRLERDDEAIASYSEAIRLFPHDLNSLANRGEIYLKQGKLDLALADLKAAIDLDPNRESGPANRARFLVFATQEVLKNADQKDQQKIEETKPPPSK